MKFLQKVFIILSLFSIVFIHTKEFSPENTVIFSDVEGVAIQLQKNYGMSLVGYIMSKTNPFYYPQALKVLYNLDNRFKKDKDGEFIDAEGNKINGITFQMLYYAMENTTFMPYAAKVLIKLHESYDFIEPTQEILNNLKNSGYTIVFATNKDRVAYDLLQQEKRKRLENIAQFIVVAHPANSQKVLQKFKEFSQHKNTPHDCKQFIEKALTIQETEKIRHAPGKKPDALYFNHIRQLVGKDKNIIFIDDIEKNVKEFNALQKEDNTVTLHGIHYQNPAQLTKELIKINVLSKMKDKNQTNNH